MREKKKRGISESLNLYLRVRVLHIDNYKRFYCRIFVLIFTMIYVRYNIYKIS